MLVFCPLDVGLSEAVFKLRDGGNPWYIGSGLVDCIVSQTNGKLSGVKASNCRRSALNMEGGSIIIDVGYPNNMEMPQAGEVAINKPFFMKV